MNGEDRTLMHKAWEHNLSSIQKMAYSDGASAGQEAAYQTSFDMGYEQGLSLGLKLGSTTTDTDRSREIINNLIDVRKINCHICVNGIQSQENCGNLYNTQQEKNLDLLKKLEE